MRLRTLPLAASGIVCGTAVAAGEKDINWPVGSLALITAFLLQVLSNFANDYGDYAKGADTAERTGTPRALQAGLLTQKEMLWGMWLCGMLALASGICLLVVSNHGAAVFASFFLLGIAALAAAVKYTVGRSAYGYSGGGDAFVFVFFGPVAVVGTAYLCSGETPVSLIWLPATGFGCLSAGVLNVNNIRDMHTDKKAGKRTLALRLGHRGSKTYHALLMLIAFSTLLAYSFRSFPQWHQHLWLLAVPALLFNTLSVLKLPPGAHFNALLKNLALLTLLLSLLLAAGSLF